MRIFSLAKINLHLRVGALGQDGFHPLLSWMCMVGLRDTIEIESTERAGIRLSCDRADVPVDGMNLIVRAGKALSAERGADVVLRKKIPMGGGLGGGSSNAAFALVGFNRVWDLGLTNQRLSEIGARLGSDVAFFLHGPSSVCAGRGEIVKPIGRPAAKFAVLIFPKFSMSTPAVYRRFDEMKLGSADAIEREPDWKAWTKLPAEELLEVLVNDLEAPAFSLCGELGEMRENIERKVGRIVRMSGSGSTLFTLVDGRNEGERAVGEIGGMGIDSELFDLSPELMDTSTIGFADS